VGGWQRGFSAVNIAGCLASVNNQSYKNIENIIIDGASIDNTLDKIQSTTNQIATIVCSSADSKSVDEYKPQLSR